MSEKKAALPRDLKKQNLEEILRAIGGQTTFTISQISGITNISRLTVKRAVDFLLERNIIVSVGKGESSNVGGKRPQEYSLNPKQYIINIYAARLHYFYTLMNFTGEVLDCIERKFSLEESYESYIREAKRCSVELIERNQIKMEQLFGIIVCSGGIIDNKEEIIFTSNTPGWGRKLHFTSDIQNIIGSQTAVVAENVAKVSDAALFFNEEVSDKRIAVFYADYGISITMLEYGKLQQTRHNVAGELGHMCLDPNDKEKCGCGAHGCFEVLVSERRMEKKIRALAKEEQGRLLKGWKKDKDLREYLLSDECTDQKLARPLNIYMADIIGLAMRNVYLAFDPDSIVFVGVFSKGPEYFYDRIRERICENEYLSQRTDIEFYLEKRDLSDLLQQGGLNYLLSSVIEMGVN